MNIDGLSHLNEIGTFFRDDLESAIVQQMHGTIETESLKVDTATNEQ